MFFFFKQKTAYELRISDWSSDVCSSDLQSETAAVRSVFIIDPDKKIRLTMTYPMSVGRNFAEILRVIDALQTSDKFRIATPADWEVSKDVIIPPSIKDDEAATLFPQGWTTLRPYLRTTKGA